MSSYFEGSFYPHGDIKGYGSSEGCEPKDSRIDFKLWRSATGPLAMYLGTERKMSEALAKEIDLAIVKEINEVRKTIMSRSPYVHLITKNY